MFSDFLSTLAAAGSATTISRARIAIADAAAAGRLSQEAASALEAVARVAAESIAVHGEKPERPEPARTSGKPAQSNTDDRLPATITECVDASYDDSGEIVRGLVTTDDGNAIRFRIPRSWGGSISAIYGACGVHIEEPADRLAGKAVSVTLGTFTGKDGIERPVIKKWHKPAAPAKAATAKPAALAWESDEAAAPRAPRRTTAAKAHAAFKANVAAPEDDDTIPF
jgi:hypothetical protein